MAPRRTCQTKGEETFGAFCIGEVHSMHASKNNQRHGFVRTRHHVVWPVWCACQASHEWHVTHSHVSCGRHHRAKILLTLLSSLLAIQPGTEADRCPWIQQRAQELQIQEAANALCQAGKAVGDDVVSVTEADEQEQAERFQCHNHTTETALFQTLGHANV